ncbi:alpha/beta hydrolase family protein, partial [Arsenicibacter rosenii]|uniref:alpha/beta hydrolase family protein n=1 Tax=Arsenicibacter rosenii TaxID=1750698 RepID=UPI001C42E754
MNGKFTLKILAYTVAGLSQYGALLVPQGTSHLPVRLLINGFGLGITTNAVSLALDSSLADSPFILAIPALRGQSLALTVNGTLYTSPLSEGDHCDAFDGATDDTIAFLNLIGQTESRADVNRTAVRGGSRGGTVALLAGIRDKRIKRVVGVVCPTDLVTLTAQHEKDPTYRCQFLTTLSTNGAGLAATRNRL